MFLAAYYHGIAVASAFYGWPRAGGTDVAAATDLVAANGQHGGGTILTVVAGDTTLHRCSSLAPACRSPSGCCHGDKQHATIAANSMTRPEKCCRHATARRAAALCYDDALPACMAARWDCKPTRATAAGITSTRGRGASVVTPLQLGPPPMLPLSQPRRQPAQAVLPTCGQVVQYYALPCHCHPPPAALHSACRGTGTHDGRELLSPGCPCRARATRWCRASAGSLHGVQHLSRCTWSLSKHRRRMVRLLLSRPS